MGKHREVMAILADVLKAAGSGTTKTRIMFKANLSYKLLEKYLGMGIEKGFVKLQGSSYQLSKEGRAFLNEYSDFTNRNSMVMSHLRELNIERERLEQICSKNGNNHLVKVSILDE